MKALAYGRSHREKLIELMNQKEVVGDVFNQLRLALQRRTAGREAQVQCVQIFRISFGCLLSSISSIMTELDCVFEKISWYGHTCIDLL